MGLRRYQAKRNFKDTPEPPGKKTAARSALSFVVQRHKASRLHYDFRLEVDGVLKSWAVPKGPSMNPKDKRLAMMVEDHPYDYKDFAGVIPKGNYGAGIVEIWDKGTVSDIEDSDKKQSEKYLRAGIKAGNLKFRLNGRKLKGEFALVRLKGKEDNAWLLIKHKDEFAVSSEYNSEEQTPKSSPINKWLAKHKKESTTKVKAKTVRTVAKKKAVTVFPEEKNGKLSEFIKPMLAQETDQPFDDPEWIYEIKWDGYRAIAEVKGKQATLYSRNGLIFNTLYSPLLDELKKLEIHAIMDGEVVVLNEKGKSSFQLLQQYDKSNDKIVYQVFDLLFLKGKDITHLPLKERKEMLQLLLSGKSDIIRYSDHIIEKGTAFFNAAVKNNLEGIIAKKFDSHYHAGFRSAEWLKIKHHKTVEAIVVGFTQPRGGRKFFGALVLAMKDGKKIKYVGHTGSGFDQSTLKDVSALLKPLIQEESPFEGKVKTNMPVTWVKPKLIAEIKYTEWTDDGRLRHPIFLRMRNDKKINEVSIKKIKPVKKKAIKRAPGTVKLKSTSEEMKDESILSFGRIKVPTTNLSKIFWPEEGITKGDVIQYYQSISQYILPYLKGRPQSLKRNPNGIRDHGFFHKDAGGSEAPEWIKSKAIFSKSTQKYIDYIICDNAATLAYLNNLGCIEINPWNSTIVYLDKPDYMIIDIDPSEKNTFDQVIEVAQVIHDILKKAGVDCYCKTSGASGIHVYIPVAHRYTYDQIKDFALLICMMVNEQLPSFTSLERNLKKRGNKKIYLDHLQNRKGQTISSVYSLRPVEGATVSAPLEWREVKPGLTPLDFTIYNILKRIQKKGDLFLPVLGKGVNLEKCFKLLDR